MNELDRPRWYPNLMTTKSFSDDVCTLSLTFSIKVIRELVSSVSASVFELLLLLLLILFDLLVDFIFFMPVRFIFFFGSVYKQMNNQGSSSNQARNGRSRNSNGNNNGNNRPRTRLPSPEQKRVMLFELPAVEIWRAVNTHNSLRKENRGTVDIPPFPRYPSIEFERYMSDIYDAMSACSDKRNGGYQLGDIGQAYLAKLGITNVRFDDIIHPMYKSVRNESSRRGMIVTLLQLMHPGFMYDKDIDQFMDLLSSTIRMSDLSSLIFGVGCSFASFAHSLTLSIVYHKLCKMNYSVDMFELFEQQTSVEDEVTDFFKEFFTFNQPINLEIKFLQMKPSSEMIDELFTPMDKIGTPSERRVLTDFPIACRTNTSPIFYGRKSLSRLLENIHSQIVDDDGEVNEEMVDEMLNRWPTCTDPESQYSYHLRKINMHDGCRALLDDETAHRKIVSALTRFDNASRGSVVDMCVCTIANASYIRLRQLNGRDPSLDDIISMIDRTGTGVKLNICFNPDKMDILLYRDALRPRRFLRYIEQTAIIPYDDRNLDPGYDSRTLPDAPEGFENMTRYARIAEIIGQPNGMDMDLYNFIAHANFDSWFKKFKSSLYRDPNDLLSSMSKEDFIRDICTKEYPLFVQLFGYAPHPETLAKWIGYSRNKRNARPIMGLKKRYRASFQNCKTCEHILKTGFRCSRKASCSLGCTKYCFQHAKENSHIVGNRCIDP
jgi:hypothetical protein